MLLEPLATDDVTVLKSLIKEYAHHTHSAKAEGILADWDNERLRFVRVIPEEYKRLLGARNPPL